MVQRQTLKKFVGSAVFAVSILARPAYALSEPSVAKLEAVKDDRVDYLEFVAAFNEAAAAEGKSVDALVGEFQASGRDIDYAYRLADDQDFWKLSFLLDHKWNYAARDSRGYNLLHEVIIANHQPNVVLVLRMGGYAYLQEKTVGGLLAEIHPGDPEFHESENQYLQAVLSPWLKYPADQSVIAGAPTDLQVEGTSRRLRGARGFGGAGAMEAALPSNDVASVEVPYATNRAFSSKFDPTRRPGASKYFSYSESAALSYGVATVTIPPTHERGKLEDLGILEFHADPRKHVILEKLKVMADEPTFFRDFAKRLERRGRKVSDPAAQDIFVYVHGFNVDFNYAMRKTAQLIYDMDFPGVPLAFSWPAHMVQLALPDDFRDDVKRANVSVTLLEKFLRKVRSEFPQRRINIIAHSLGTRVLAQVLVRLATIDPDPTAPKFGEVILAAPAMDAAIFSKAWATDILRICERVSVMASRHDYALKVEPLAEVPGFSFPLGLWSGKRAAVTAGVLNFDLSAMSHGTFSLDHSLYSEVKEIIALMGNLIMRHPKEAELKSATLQPDKRHDWFSAPGAEDRDYWKFIAP